jgi:hypothetical protein
MNSKKKNITWVKYERTNNVILRFIGNRCEVIAYYALTRCMWDEQNGSIWARISNALYKPALRWGTYYNMEEK